MTIDEELTVSFVSRFTSISLHAPEPLHYLRSGSHGFSLPPPPTPTPLTTHTRLPGQRSARRAIVTGEIDDSEASRVQLDEITGDQAGQDCRNLDG